MAFYTLSIQIEATSKQEAEQKLQQLLKGAALPQRTILNKVLGGVAVEIMEHYLAQNRKTTRLDKVKTALDYIQNQQLKKE